MHTNRSIPERIIGNQSLRIILSTFLVLAMLFAGIPVQGVRAASTLTVTKTADTDDGLCDRDCSLREAIYAANSGDTIVFSRSLTITLRSQLPTISTRITIKGRGATKTIIQASKCNPRTLPGNCKPAAYRVFEVGRRGNLTLDGVTVRHGTCDGWCVNAEEQGGGIYNAGTLSVKNSIVQYNVAAWEGGGIYSALNGKLTITNSSITNNRADFSGGGISSASSATVTNSKISSNGSLSYGGGITNWEGGRLTLINSTLWNNGADYDGGGIYSVGTSLKLSRCSVSENSAGNNGGGIHNAGLQLTMKNCTVSENYALNGGGIYSVSELTVAGSSLESNTARQFEGSGGAIHNEDGTLTLTDSFLTGNFAYMGGGVYNTGNLEVVDTTFSRNNADYIGGGISNSSTAYVTDSTFSDNSAAEYGGGIWNGSWMSVTNGTFSGNSAPYGPGLLDDGTAYLTDTVPDN
jgi:CSLREA domain-containing protein